jgi:hypothetical protein
MDVKHSYRLGDTVEGWLRDIMPKASKKANVVNGLKETITVGGNIDYAAIYDQIDAEKTTKVKRDTATADQIREVIDGLFASGKTEVAVATVVDVVNISFGLTKVDKEHDNTVQNSSVRSAGEAGGKYKIHTIQNVALFRKV